MTREPYRAIPDSAVFDHTCIAGRSMRRLLSTYRDMLGGELAWGEELPIGVVVLTITYPGGGGNIELMAPTQGSTFLDSFFARTGGVGGVHHLTYIVDDFEVAVAQAEAAGYSIFGVSTNTKGWSEAFIHPRSNDGVLIQIARASDEMPDLLRRDFDVLLAAVDEPDEA